MSSSPAPMEVAARMGRLRASFDAAGCDALLVSSLTNLRYLTGFTGSAGMLLVWGDGALLVTDGRYRSQSAEQLAGASVEADVAIGAVAEQRTALASAGTGRGRIGLEATSISWELARSLSAEVFRTAEVVPTTGLVEGLRRVKDPGEVDRIAVAAGIADRALEAVLDLVREGRSEAEVALQLDYEMRRLGAQGPAFETIVASGPNGAKPHARPGGRAIQPGDMVVIDFGALFDGYRSDMTRTFALGEPDVSELARVYEVVRSSQAAGVAKVGAGVPAVEVDSACRNLIAEAGWGDEFVHGTGHGVGIDIHEAPAVSATSTDTLREAEVVTVEPGIYLPGRGGVRIEDTVVVTAGGCQTLTGFPKDMVLA